MNKRFSLALVLISLLLVAGSLPGQAQTITATLEGQVVDASGAVVPGATITAINTGTGLSRSARSSEVGEYRIPALPVGEYTVSAELAGFRREVKKVTLRISQTARIDFTLQVGQVTQEVVVEATSALLEPTRTTVASVIVEKQIETLPVNGRQFIDFSLLAPGVNIGDTTSGSTDVIVEPVTKLAFGGQNIHYNFVAIDGADNISTASSIQKTTPSQEAVKEFQVINSTYSTEFGRAAGGIVNIVTKSGSNDLHGSVYEFFQNDAFNAKSLLSRPGLTKLQQNQFGFTLGGPVVRDKTFFFANYEGQRRRESPFYNSALFDNIDRINAAKIGFGLRPENLNVTRTSNTDNLLFKLDHAISEKHFLSGRYFFNDGRFLKLSPLNDGFDSPSTFRNNFFRDQSAVVNLTSTASPTFLNDLRGQFARRTFDFPATTAEPHLEIINLFTTGVNRGNPDKYRETRFELVDQATLTRGKHTVNFGGNTNFVRTFESFPLFSPGEIQFLSVDDYVAGNPVVFFWETFPAGTTTLIGETGVDPAIFQLDGFPADVRKQASTEVDHTYNGFFIQDKWRATSNLTLNFGLRYEFETWPESWVDNDWDNVDPRFGFAYNVGTRANLVIRGGFGLFHGIIPSPLLLCQEPSCGGSGPLLGRENIQDELNARTRLFLFVSGDPTALQNALTNFLTTGAFPTLTGPFDFIGENTIVRFVRDHDAPYAIQTSLGFEMEPVRDLLVNVSYLRVKGLSLGSFYNANQPSPSGTLLNGKADFCLLRFGPFVCAIPGSVDPRFALFFEATDRWRSVYDGLLLNANKRFSRHYGFGVSYTFSKSIDDGPNPSFVLIPENSGRLDLDRAVSSDHVAHRFVANSTIAGPTDVHPLVNDFEFGTIITIRSPHFFTIFTGFDANGDGFPLNDRIEGRNTFKGDSFRSVDFRLSRSFYPKEDVKLEFIGEVFNFFNTLNVRFFNTVYGDVVFNPPGTPGTFLDGARNPAFGTPRAINNPRQFQFALRLTF
ncbi:MAG: carboxypeptidase regulatory-like domain-containing protein [Terriglobia bacterium]